MSEPLLNQKLSPAPEDRCDECERLLDLYVHVLKDVMRSDDALKNTSNPREFKTASLKAEEGRKRKAELLNTLMDHRILHWHPDDVA